MCWVGVLALALEEVAVDYRDVAVCLIDHVEAPDIAGPGFAGGGFAGHEADAVEAREETGEALHYGAEGEVGGEDVSVAATGAHGVHHARGVEVLVPRLEGEGGARLLFQEGEGFDFVEGGRTVSVCKGGEELCYRF